MQNYQLPEGWTWEDVEEQRQKWDISADKLPLVSSGGVVAWGVPSPESLRQQYDEATKHSEPYPEGF